MKERHELRTFFRTGIVMMVLASLLAMGQAAFAADRILETKDGQLKVESFAKGLEFPWGLAFLPDGRMLVTERPGRLRIVAKDGTLSEPLQGVPEVLA
ncbi:MAG TPA: PQQ-dependent sugar dehydrogenase, partial [Methyloceanibacter sp.]|nr:PQQ-dependent sugar dehydrogenase [Methyloceanibacter sp.]